MQNRLFERAAFCAVLLAGLCGAVLTVAQPARGSVVFDVAPRVDRTALLAAAMRGQQVVAVGERGAAFVSLDGGHDWNGRRVTKTTKTLTSMVALDDRVWIAGGHGGVLLRSDDGTRSVTSIENDSGGESILGLAVLDPRTVIAYGAFGTLLRSTDAGLSWERITVIDEDFDRHLYGIVKLADGLLLVGESGTLARSADGGLSWQRLASPYQGSFFGGLQTPGGAILLFGMRGSIYRSVDRGGSWQKVAVDTVQPFFGAAVSSDGRIVLSGGRGVLASSRDDGAGFELHRDGSKDIGGLIVRSDGKLVGYGAMGVREMTIPGL